MPSEFFQLLQKDHDDVKNLFSQLLQSPSASPDVLKKTLHGLKLALLPHLEAEEGSFYAALRGRPEAKEAALQAIEEHHVTKLLFAELEKTGVEREQFRAKAGVLREIVEHHIREEEGKIFELAQKMLNEGQQLEIMQVFKNKKERVKGKL
jgi:predicted DNA-binding protein